MTTSSELLPLFESVKDANERIYWTGRPNFKVFLLQGVPFLAIGLIWGIIDFSFIGIFMSSATQPGKDGNAGPGLLFLIPFFTLHLFPFWGSILNMVRLYLAHSNTAYAVTNKRLMIRGGFWGTSFKSIDYDKIAELEVTVNPIENKLNVGTIKAYSGVTNQKGFKIYDNFVGIVEPYKVFKRIKEISVDVKTDWNSPNDNRPKNNSGYQTEHKPDTDPS
jgi:hypothetical protein